MAVEDIQATVLANTGRTPTANSVEDAQRFVVSSIPSDLLLWAITETIPGTHGGNNSAQQITLPVKSDSLVYVRRDQFEAKKVNGSMRGFIGNSSSLHKATATFPKYYIADGNRVIVKPDPDNTYTAHAQYVDYAKLNDDSDLRNAVINYSTSREFTALALSTTFPSVSWGKETPPTFTAPIMQQPDWSDVENWITTEEDSEMLGSRVQAIRTQVDEFSANVQLAQTEFNSELEDYKARIAETIQINQGKIAEWQAENSVKLSQYLQLSAQYYNWALSEIKSYVENNEKTFKKVENIQRGSRSGK